MAKLAYQLQEKKINGNRLERDGKTLDEMLFGSKLHKFK